MAALFRRAVRAYRRPKYLITDLGTEFTAGAFKRTVRRLGSVQRFASAGSLEATARLERYWRTLKDSAGLHGLQLALTLDDLERRLELALLHYICFRPHEGLDGATPLEVFLREEPACLKAVEPPRGRPREGKGAAPVRVVFLDHANRRFSILTPAG